MKQKQKSSNKDELKKRSRPCKKTKKSIGAGGKRVPIEEASNRMFRRRAKELLSTRQCNSRILEIAAKIEKKESEKIQSNKKIDINHDESSVNSKRDTKIIRHSKESALAFYLEYNYSVKVYKALVSDTIARNCRIYPA